ncbi:MAG TPA: hypothetical protein VM537_18750, partial [Anaerolineae bacterium]|nr:hypothetical protein [Anaerolineae bacterium]
TWTSKDPYALVHWNDKWFGICGQGGLLDSSVAGDIILQSIVRNAPEVAKTIIEEWKHAD